MWTKNPPHMSGASVVGQPRMSGNQTRSAGGGSVAWPGRPRGKCDRCLCLLLGRGAGAGQRVPVSAPRPQEGDVGLVMESDSQPQDHDSAVSASSFSSSLSQPISESESELLPEHWTLFTEFFLCSAICHTEVCHNSGYNLQQISRDFRISITFTTFEFSWIQKVPKAMPDCPVHSLKPF